MADEQADPDDVTGTGGRPYAHAFGLLGAVELSRWPDWAGPEDPGQLRGRVELLAVLLDMVPHADLGRLDPVVAAWCRRYPDPRPVAAAELRRMARAVLEQSAYRVPPDGGTDDGLRQALALVRRPQLAVADPQPAPTTPEERIDEAEAERRCAFGLGVWFTQLANNPRWRYLPAVVPGEAPVEIDQVYVELFAVSDPTDTRQTEAASPQRVSRRLLAADHPAVTIPTMVARTLRQCVVVGEPGSGKSTLVQWLARATRRRQCPDFDAALVVKLSAFAAALADEPELSLLEFFFSTLGTRIDDWRPAAAWLRRVAGERHRFLLLLDGWDEVPGRQRERVRERILAEQPHFVTVITSRPSGQPRQLCANEVVDFYAVAGLTPPAVEDLVGKLLSALGCPHLAEPILTRIRRESDLGDMASNPFLLGLLVRVLVRSAGRTSAPRTLAEVYRQVSAWVQEHHDLGRGAADPLTAGHIAALRGLAYGLLFDADRPRYLFHGRELTEGLGGQSAEPIWRSRFVHRIDPVFDEYAFLHATFQEYFAAEQASALTADALDELLDHAFASASRFIVLEFIAGCGGRSSRRCRERAVEWWRRQDRFRQVLLRVARLAAAGRWPPDLPPGFGPRLREELWRAIHQNQDMSLTQAAVAAYAELDPVDLARRARGARGLDNWAIQCIVDAVPKPVARQEQLDDLLSGEWRDYAGLDARGGATDADRAAIRAVLQDSRADLGERRTAVIRAGAAKDAAAVPALLALLADPTADRDLHEQAIDSLGTIGGRQAVDALVDVVVGDRPLGPEAVTMAVAVLRHSGMNRKALDPVGRDRLVRRLAALPADDPLVKPILAALEACPLRDGAEVIEQLTQPAGQHAAVRSAAVGALAAAADRPLVQRVVTRIAAEPAGEVAGALLRLAVRRDLAVPLPWLEGKIGAARDRRQLRELLTAYVTVFPHAGGAERAGATVFLGRQLAHALAGATPAAGELAWALERALDPARRRDGLLPDDALPQSRSVLARFAAAPTAVMGVAVALAARVAAYCGHPAARSDLRAALDAALEMAETDTHDPAKLALALANGLAEVAPGELLTYPEDCECVRSVLCSLAVRRGWMVFRDRITDAEGWEVATAAAATAAAPRLDQPADFRAILDGLPLQSQRVLRGYWLLVKDGGPCRPSDTLKSIYAELCGRLDGTIDDDLAKQLDPLFPDGCPPFGSWTKALQRIERRFAGQADMLVLLRSIGLCRRPRGAEPVETRRIGDTFATRPKINAP